MTSDKGERILIVEDDPMRCAWFEQKFSGHHIVDITCDVREAAVWLAARDYSLILLDHDLSEEHYFSDEPDDERTGYAVAAWLAAHPDRQRDATIVIHSLNYAGAQRMLDALRDAGRDAEHVPFHYLQTGLRL
ncbi:MAG TPA: cyclic-phosphate processing receiver domain-containing protein [Pyrinomonadaceae bacterium]|jgi:CheY-like chemotaxis protein|nr:cyclic-phosphate processing receiver domain-containing protein [Pyrinomonadaceae bacterium]